jgi:hypothetical protein
MRASRAVSVASSLLCARCCSVVSSESRSQPEFHRPHFNPNRGRSVCPVTSTGLTSLGILSVGPSPIGPSGEGRQLARPQCHTCPTATRTAISAGPQAENVTATAPLEGCRGPALTPLPRRARALRGWASPQVHTPAGAPQGRWPRRAQKGTMTAACASST